MIRRLLLLVAAMFVAGGAWLGYESGQWHYLAVMALAPIIWLAGRG